MKKINNIFVVSLMLSIFVIAPCFSRLCPDTSNHEMIAILKKDGSCHVTKCYDGWTVNTNEDGCKEIPEHAKCTNKDTQKWEFGKCKCIYGEKDQGGQKVCRTKAEKQTDTKNTKQEKQETTAFLADFDKFTAAFDTVVEKLKTVCKNKVGYELKNGECKEKTVEIND